MLEDEMTRQHATKSTLDLCCTHRCSLLCSAKQTLFPALCRSPLRCIRSPNGSPSDRRLACWYPTRKLWSMISEGSQNSRNSRVVQQRTTLLCMISNWDVYLLSVGELWNRRKEGLPSEFRPPLADHPRNRLQFLGQQLHVVLWTHNQLVPHLMYSHSDQSALRMPDKSSDSENWPIPRFRSRTSWLLPGETTFEAIIKVRRIIPKPHSSCQCHDTFELFWLPVTCWKEGKRNKQQLGRTGWSSGGTAYHNTKGQEYGRDVYEITTEIRERAANLWSARTSKIPWNLVSFGFIGLFEKFAKS